MCVFGQDTLLRGGERDEVGTLDHPHFTDLQAEEPGDPHRESQISVPGLPSSEHHCRLASPTAVTQPLKALGRPLLASQFIIAGE